MAYYQLIIRKATVSSSSQSTNNRQQLPMSVVYNIVHLKSPLFYSTNGCVSVPVVGDSFSAVRMRVNIIIIIELRANEPEGRATLQSNHNFSQQMMFCSASTIYPLFPFSTCHYTLQKHPFDVM